MSVETIIESAFAGMDRNGMYPADLTCARCGRTLNADGGHPAELYAGTFNGLCYGCTSSGAYVEKTYVLDGALYLNYPPACPSHRRDRRNYYGYADCETCKGTGVIGSYDRRRQCEPCLRRFLDHPLRKRMDEAKHLARNLTNAKWKWAIVDAAGIGTSARKAIRKRKRHEYPRNDFGHPAAMEPTDKSMASAWSLLGTKPLPDEWEMDERDGVVTLTKESANTRLVWGDPAVTKTSIFSYTHRKDWALFTKVDGDWALTRAPFSSMVADTDDPDEAMRKGVAFVWAHFILAPPLLGEHRRVEEQLRTLAKAWRIHDVQTQPIAA